MSICKIDVWKATCKFVYWETTLSFVVFSPVQVV